MTDLPPTASLPADQVHANVAAMWDLTTSWPIPRRDIWCPVCKHGPMTLKDFRFFERKGGTVPHRCDVTTKCTSCSLVLTFGVAVPADVFAAHQTGRTFPWRWVRDQLEESGGPVGPDSRQH